MTTPKEVQELVKKKPSNVYGLRWVPTIDGLDDVDLFGEGDTQNIPSHWSKLDEEALLTALSTLKNPKLIVEIGVDAPYNGDLSLPSSTKTILNWKPDSCVYIGIDISDKTYLANKEKNVYILQQSSSEKQKVYDKMNELGLNQIDFMHVDGYHSITEVLDEWEYWERMTPFGIMAFHDTNHHPGPIAVLDAVDPEIFDVVYYGRGEPDWGVGVVRRKKYE